jgi:hypothetical protein
MNIKKILQEIKEYFTIANIIAIIAMIFIAMIVLPKLL